MLPSGYRHSELTKKKIGNANRGRVFSLESRMNMRRAALGRIPWNKGKKFSSGPKIHGFCFSCKKPLLGIGPYRFKKNPKRYCSDCYKKTWKGRTTHGDGYILVTVIPGRKGKKELEHRLVMEKILGRKLRPKEVVHHKNHNRKDNRPENLELCESAGRHIADHHRIEYVIRPQER